MELLGWRAEWCYLAGTGRVAVDVSGGMENLCLKAR